MDIKTSFYIMLLTFTAGFYSCGCEEDIYGKYLELELPIDTYPARDTFKVGDTLWIEASFDKNVKTRNNQINHILLENFSFFTFFTISEISDTAEIFNLNFEIISITGKIDKLILPTAVSYPLEYVESENLYYFKGAIVLLEPGLYTSAFYTESLLYENFEHPAVYMCEGERRNKIEVYYVNKSTNLKAFENLFLSTNVAYLKELYTFEGYKDIGSHTFVVVEE